MRYVWVLALVFSAQSVEGQQAQRVAAALFAKENGFDIPAATAVARETLSDSTRPGAAPMTPSDARSAAADAIVASLRLTAGAGSVRELIECRKLLCVGKGQTAVLVVGDPADSRGGTVVQLELYAPGITPRGDQAQTVTVALVEVQLTGGRWTGVDYRIRPIKSFPKLPPDDRY